MSWFPIGPDFVREPRVLDFQRLSRRNVWGAQGRINCVAFENGSSGGTPETIYLVVRDGSGQCAAFRRRTTETAWAPISDELRQADSNVDPQSVAVSPHDPGRTYLATWNDQGLFVSSNRGTPGSWSPKRPVPGRVRKLVIDPRPVPSVAATVLYVATDDGVYRSGDDGVNWTLVLSGDVWSFSFRIAASGALHAYAGVYQSGVWYADTEPLTAAAWTNLDTTGIGLPAYVPGSATTPETFHAILVDCCPANPARAYAWFVRPTGTSSPEPAETAGLYTTGAPRTAWTLANPLPAMAYQGSLDPLHPMQGFNNFVFAVAPNSPGDGLADILFFGNLGNARSTDGGVTWKPVRQFFHNDMHGYAFYPEDHVPGLTPTFYIGCDGGLGANARAADPGFAVETDPSSAENNAGTVLVASSGVFVNLNGGLQNNLVYVLGGDSEGIAPPYLGCVDTALAVRAGGLGWRAFGGGDTFELAVALGTTGVKLWQKYHGGDRMLMSVSTDTGQPQLSAQATAALSGETASWIMPASNFALDASGQCLVGATIEETLTTTTALVSPGTDVVVPVVSTAGITGGTYLALGVPPNRQAATAFDVTATSFTVPKIYAAKPAGSAVRPIRPAVLRVDQAGVAQRISQRFAAGVTLVAASATASPNTLACATADGRLWRVDATLTTSGPATWVEVAAGKPAGATIAWMAVSPTGDLLVLLLDAVSSGPPAAPLTTPLFLIPVAGAAWEPQVCVGLPTTTLADGNPQPFGRLVFDPIQPDTAYAIHGAQVYRARRQSTSGGGTVWVWTPVAPGLPGCWVSDLWIGNLAASGSAAARVVLRAGVIGRGVWETDVTAGAATPAVDLHVRRHPLDHGWLPTLRDGLTDPYDPAHHVWHYQCADVKVEAPQSAPTGLVFYQTDPEASGVEYSGSTTPVGPITNVQFDQLRDDSQLVPAGTSVRMHAQVQNRSHTPADGVRVWTLYTPAAAGVPALGSTTSGGTFPFWSQFQADGQILPALPVTSRWKAVGPPVVLDGVDASHPRVASWRWPVPTLTPGQAGHYCLAVFVHSASAPLSGITNVDLDDLTIHEKRVGQKNVHLVGPKSGAGAGAGSSQKLTWPELYVEFHNPTRGPRESSLVVDLRTVPAEVQVSLRFTRLGTRRGVARGGAPSRPTRHVGRPGDVVRIEGVTLRPGGFAAVRVSCRATRLPASIEEFRLEVQQLVRERVVGGSTFVLSGRRDLQSLVHNRPTPADFAERERVAREDASRYVPPWIRRLRAVASPPTAPPPRRSASR